ncbi:MAG: hypothetical protein AAGA58_16070, partial [Verrucomicrobiota bacterium]
RRRLRSSPISAPSTLLSEDRKGGRAHRSLERNPLGPQRRHVPVAQHMRVCMGTDVEEVTALNAQSSHEIFAKYEYPTTTTALIKFKSGKVGKCASVIDCFQPYYFHTHLVGSEGSILDNKIYSNKLHLRDKKWTELPVALADSGDVHDHPYQAQFQAFFDAIDAGEEMPLTSYADAFQTFEVLFAIDESAATGKAVKL